jgi:ABC-type polysaccharide/polyol phosphate transport system ATPase subunit
LEASRLAAMIRNTIIQLDDVCLILRNFNQSHRSIKKFALSAFSRDKHFITSNLVLDKINLKIRRGESLAIIGPNGSGKSTLLRVISRIYSPTSGTIQGNPSIVPLIELDGAFNGELTVDENIELLAMFHNVELEYITILKREVLDFSELEMHSNQPMRVLSTGMKARFAFAFATSLKSDLIAIDESLSVGDINFSQKAKAKIRGLQSEGVSLILVTHDLELAKEFTTKCLWIEGGKVKAYGGTKNIVSRYTKSLMK